MVPVVEGEVVVVDAGGVAVVGVVPIPGVVVGEVPVTGVVPPTGGVVPGVVLGVVPGVVLGVVPGVVLGVVLGVVVGVAPVVGGHTRVVADGLMVVLPVEVPGEVVLLIVPVVVPVEGVIVPVELGDVAQIPLCIGLVVVVDVGDGVVPDCAGLVDGKLLFVVGMDGVVPWTDEFPVAVPGAVVVGIAGVVPPAPVVCAAAIPTQRHTAAVSESKRVIMRISLLLEIEMAAPKAMDAINRELRQGSSQ